MRQTDAARRCSCISDSSRAANTARYCVAYRTMRRIYKTLKAGVSFVKLITNNNCETLVREQCELPMPLNNWLLNVRRVMRDSSRIQRNKKSRLTLQHIIAAPRWHTMQRHENYYFQI